MALGMIKIKSGKRGKTVPHFNYILGLGDYADKDSEITHIEHLNMPQWAESPADFWQASDELERKNGSTYREHILSLPREFTHEQNLELVHDWINERYGNSHPISFAFHEPLGSDDLKQPHCHLMICERKLDGIERSKQQFFKRYNAKNLERGGCQKINTGLHGKERKYALLETRFAWGDMLNKHLLKNGFEANVDMRGWFFRGLSEKPENLIMSDYNKIKRQKQAERAEQIEFENSIVSHYENCIAANIEHRYDPKKYSLFRAVKSLQALKQSLKSKDSDKFMLEFRGYRNAIYGRPALPSERQQNFAINERSMDGEVGFLEKMDYSGISQTRYHSDNPMHLYLKNFGKSIAKRIHADATSIVEQAQDAGFLEESDKKYLSDVASFIDKQIGDVKPMHQSLPPLPKDIPSLANIKRQPTIR